MTIQDCSQTATSILVEAVQGLSNEVARSTIQTYLAGVQMQQDPGVGQEIGLGFEAS
jgi:hypothetical protein